LQALSKGQAHRILVTKRTGLVLLIAAAQFVTLAVVGTSSADATHYVGQHWYNDHGLPVVPHLRDHTTGGWPAQVQAAQSEWSSRSSRVDFYYYQHDSGNTGYCDWNWLVTYGQFPNIEICNAWYGQPGWYGYFQPDQTGHLTKGFIQFDDADSPNDAGAKRYIACHELSHAIGLGHRASGSSCLNIAAPGHQHPDSHDIEMLDRNIYLYLDGDARHDSCYNAMGAFAGSRPPAITTLGLLATGLDYVVALADDARTMVVYPDGSAAPLRGETDPAADEVESNCY
jgi:hypothetical protein